ncbi:hypothetical protein SAY87_022290 [Trapa incisa]|uniref:DUF177 domain-containing protein n=1 Tax=Trapa incisa TaxID=236973 RepID=A0AAN7K3Z4_9MYRT|nr:hypothetical protein SAY87_022290 [Trapa incisa]
MSMLIPSTFIPLAHLGWLGTSACKLHRLAYQGSFLLATEITSEALRQRHCAVSRSAAVGVGSSDFDPDSAVTLDWLGLELDGNEDTESPWEGAVMYRRNSLVSHLEYCTTLERLGLEKLSTDTSKSQASALGLRVTKSVKDYPFGTPVQISIDVSRKKKKKQKLRLDGIVRTVITLGCNRYFYMLLPQSLCGDPAAQPVYSNFSLVLTNEPIEMPEILNMGTIFREDNSNSSSGFRDEEEEDDTDDADIDMDDWLYFPLEEKEIDISKHVRDLVHLEITLNAVCNPNCKGLCLRCGTNLNKTTCGCSNSDQWKKEYGPLGNLRKQMQQQKG